MMGVLVGVRVGRRLVGVGAGSVGVPVATGALCGFTALVRVEVGALVRVGVGVAVAETRLNVICAWHRMFESLSRDWTAAL